MLRTVAREYSFFQQFESNGGGCKVGLVLKSLDELADWLNRLVEGRDAQAIGNSGQRAPSIWGFGRKDER